MGKLRPVALYSLCTLFVHSPVHAAEDIDAVVVTASRLEQQLKDTIAHTTVITAKDIRDSQAVDLSSLLRREAGFEFARNGGEGNVTGIFLRGGDGKQALVLIDGVRAGSVTLGTTQIEGILLDQVERVEIVRGNVSALYGAGAAGGVIQIFTRQANGAPRAEAQAMAGERGTSRLSAGYRGSVEDTRFSLNVSRFETGGHSAIDTRLAPRANPDNDGYRNRSFSGQIAHRIAAGHEIGLRAYQNAGEVDYDSAFGAPADRHRAENSVGSYAVYAGNALAPFWNSQLTLAEGADHGRNFTNDSAPARTDSRTSQLQWQNDFTLAAGQVVTAGLERQQQRIRSSTAYSRTGRDMNSARLAYNGRFEAQQLQLAARRDRYSDFGGAGSWLAGYGYDIDPHWRATAMRSTAFRAPTFNELFFPGFGNPDLQPERSASDELGLQYAASRHLLRAAAFRTRYRNLIDSPPPTFLPQNVSRARVEGAEVSYAGQFDRWDIRASLTVQDPISETTGARLRRRAATFGNLVASTTVSGWRLGGELIVSGARPDNDIAGGAPVTLGGYKVVNLTLRRALGRQAFIAARLENAFAEKYRLAHGYNVSGRGLFVTLGWTQQ